MSLLKQILKDWKTGKQRKKREESAKLGWNLYDSGKTLKYHKKKFYFIHFVWKYRLFLPLVRILARTLGKYLVKEVPAEDHNINLRLFHEATEVAIDQWAEQYMAKAYKKKRSPNWPDKFKKGYSCQTIRFARDMTTTMLLNDSAYREYFNIFAHTFTKMMAVHHSKEGKTGHLFFTEDDVYDVDYFLLFKQVQTHRSLALKNVDPAKHHEATVNAEKEFKGQKNI